jgi:acetate kinase
MTGTILAINAGSSSIKFSLFENKPDLKLLTTGKIEDIGGKCSFTCHAEGKKAADTEPLPAHSQHEDALRMILSWIEKQEWQITAVVHRVVHGGSLFKKPVLVTAAFLEQLRHLATLAPLHQSHNLTAIDILRKIKPDMPQITCFDTAFHATLDPPFSLYAIPEDLIEKGIRRYGFHGLSYEWVSHVLQQKYPDLAKGHVIVAHLGNGSSLCALRNGVSIDTTMGMTPLEGLPMGTRSGSLDPGAVIYMMRELKMSTEEVERILYNESGLKGLSGITHDVKQLLESSDPKAQFSLEYFCLKAAQFMGMLAVSLGGIDGIIFTGGIGENAGSIRQSILRRLSFLKPFKTYVIPANEERIMAMHAFSIMKDKISG